MNTNKGPRFREFWDGQSWNPSRGGGAGTGETRLEIAKRGAEGVIAAMGPAQEVMACDAKELIVSSKTDARRFGRSTLPVEPTGRPDVKDGKGAPGKVELYFDRKLVGEGKLPVTIPLAFGLGGGLVVGRATGFPISPRFKSECAFTGTIYDVVIDVSGD